MIKFEQFLTLHTMSSTTKLNNFHIIENIEFKGFCGEI